MIRRQVPYNRYLGGAFDGTAGSSKNLVLLPAGAQKGRGAILLATT